MKNDPSDPTENDALTPAEEKDLEKIESILEGDADGEGPEPGDSDTDEDDTEDDGLPDLD